MPELPEVETTRRGIRPHILGHRVTAVNVRERRLRWPVPRALPKRLTGERIIEVRRRAKYLLLDTASGSAILHLGMSGSVSIVDPGTPLKKHDHVDITFDSARLLRFNDPRRFGSLLWSRNPDQHKLLSGLGPEPLSDDFNGAHLWHTAQGRRLSIKPFIMDATVVAGVGNIYASEALFRAGIHPKRGAGRTALHRMEVLAQTIKEVLEEAIAAGGTTLRNFYGGDGQPGYFKQELAVYGRAGEPCVTCSTPIRNLVLGQRASYYCKSCQR